VHKDHAFKPADLLIAVNIRSAHFAQNAADDATHKKILTGFKIQLRKGRLQKDF
jgi:hypothetical protein